MFQLRWIFMVHAIFALASEPTSLAIVVTATQKSTSTNLTITTTSPPSGVDIADQAIDAKTAALPLQMQPDRNQMLPAVESTAIQDAFQLFKHLVYPAKFTGASVQHLGHIHPFARNITLDALQLLWPSLAASGLRRMNRYSNASWTPSSAMAGGDALVRRSDEPHRMPSSAGDALQDRHFYYSVDGGYPSHQQNHHAVDRPHTFYPGGGGYAGGGGNGMTHLIDPLFVMATLAFVAFLINSILGLVDRLNLIPTAVIRARHRHGKYSTGGGGGSDGDGDEFVVWPERRTNGAGSGAVGDEMLDELEQRIRTAFDEYEQCYAKANCK